MLRSLRLLHNCQLTVLVYPPPPPGAIIARVPQCRRERRCPESAYINIIPSGLCNKSPRAALVSASHTIRIMLSTLRQRVASVLPPNSRARRRQERSSLREGTTPPLRRSLRTLRVFVGTSVLCRPRSSCRLLRRLRRPQLPLRSSIGGLGGVRGRKVPTRRPSVLLDRHHPHSASVLREHPAASRTSGAGSFRAVTPLPPQAPSEESRPCTPR